MSKSPPTNRRCGEAVVRMFCVSKKRKLLSPVLNKTEARKRSI